MGSSSSKALERQIVDLKKEIAKLKSENDELGNNLQPDGKGMPAGNLNYWLKFKEERAADLKKLAGELNKEYGDKLKMLEAELKKKQDLQRQLEKIKQEAEQYRKGMQSHVSGIEKRCLEICHDIHLYMDEFVFSSLEEHMNHDAAGEGYDSDDDSVSEESVGVFKSGIIERLGALRALIASYSSNVPVLGESSVGFSKDQMKFLVVRTCTHIVLMWHLCRKVAFEHNVKEAGYDVDDIESVFRPVDNVVRFFEKFVGGEKKLELAVGRMESDLRGFLKEFVPGHDAGEHVIRLAAEDGFDFSWSGDLKEFMWSVVDSVLSPSEWIVSIEVENGVSSYAVHVHVKPAKSVGDSGVSRLDGISELKDADAELEVICDLIRFSIAKDFPMLRSVYGNQTSATLLYFFLCYGQNSAELKIWHRMCTLRLSNAERKGVLKILKELAGKLSALHLMWAKYGGYSNRCLEYQSWFKENLSVGNLKKMFVSLYEPEWDKASFLVNARWHASFINSVFKLTGLHDHLVDVDQLIRMNDSQKFGTFCKGFLERVRLLYSLDDDAGSVFMRFCSDFLNNIRNAGAKHWDATDVIIYSKKMNKSCQQRNNKLIALASKRNLLEY